MTSENSQNVIGTAKVKRGMAEMLKGGVIMDVVTAEQARIAEDAGAVAVMALERVPADIRAQGGVSRMSDPDMIDSIIGEVSIPVMAKARIAATSSGSSSAARRVADSSLSASPWSTTASPDVTPGGGTDPGRPRPVWIRCV